ncbi:uncharacterized protein NPIL_395641 [Nephila pilipes]|uniref:Gustatory receptor n=1 Tax=Nephila pilipes TaxID=299642 RepID=A0A8X6IR71_NEPPI|nr:uncharacterized protein NPIL_395641 [Nephila pilipes]
MNIPEEFRVILKYFPFTGTFFSNPKTENYETNLFDKATKLIVEIIFILYAIYIIYSSIYLGPYASKTLRVTSVIINIILLLLRLSVVSNKSRILKTLSKMRAFETMNFGRQIRSSLWKYAVFACGLCFFFPMSVAASSTALILNNIDKYDFVMVSHNSTTASFILFTIILTGHQVMYMINFYVFPGLVMTLICFVYVSYVSTFQKHLDAMRIGLLKRFSGGEMSRALAVFTQARKVHQDIEKSVSFVTFLAYVIIFGNTLHLVCASVSNYLSQEGSMRDAYSITIFSWTALWLIVLTMCGSRVTGTEVFIKNMSQEISSVKPEGPQRLMCLNFFNSCSGFNMRFSGWKMFNVDKKLILTISGVLVTYGVLLASELRKT